MSKAVPAETDPQNSWSTIFTIVAKRAQGTDFTLLITGMLAVIMLVILKATNRMTQLKEEAGKAEALANELARVRELFGAVEHKAELSKGPKTAQYMYDVFLSTPMAAYKDDEEYKAQRKESDLPFMMKDVVTDFPERVRLYDESVWGSEQGTTMFDKISNAIAAHKKEELFLFIKETNP